MATVWQAREAVRELHAHADAEPALEWVTQVGRDLQDEDYPIEARSLGRTLIAQPGPSGDGHTPLEREEARVTPTRQPVSTL